ncbi:MAG: TetR/AcrR family transcriptional regulator [Dehalococcoidia bacterium]|nr:TetR/AcrR family transcriptional regulator [Dehalococcoidia bacterium]
MPKPKMTMRKARALSTRRRIFDTAVSLFTQKGYSKVTIDDICNKMGLSKGAFYNYFKSKDQIIMEGFIASDEYYRTDALKEIASLKGRVDQLVAYNRLVLKNITRTGKPIMQAVFHSEMGFNKKASYINSDKRSLYTVGESLVEEAQKAGELRTDLSSKQITNIIVRSLRGLVYDWCLPGSKFDLEEAGEKVLEVLIDGLSAPQ